jgi:hypothetical protein
VIECFEKGLVNREEMREQKRQKKRAQEKRVFENVFLDHPG